MKSGTLILTVLVGLAGPSFRAAAQDSQSLFGNEDQTVWSWDLAAGYDATLHSYALAVDDTTETISEFMVLAGFQGRSPRGARHRWRLRGEASAGTELYRQRVEGDVRWNDSGGVTRGRLIGRFWGRQYRDDTTYTNSSDNWEGTLDGRVSPWAGAGAALDLRARAGFIDYRTPSTLEVDYRDVDLGVFARSRGSYFRTWTVGVRRGARAYPDSSEIDRDTWSLEGDYDAHDLDGAGLRIYHKSARRLIADETARPSAWTHWTDLRAAVGAAPGQVILELNNEIWQYDEETGAYYDSWRAETFLGYRWGDILATGWQAGLVFERMDAGDSPETYSQLGIRGGVEGYGSTVGGQIVLEYGRRTYDQGSVPLEDDPLGELTGDSLLLYSDFDYWRIWVMGQWALAPRLSLDVTASYEPEDHTEPTDDASIGYASIRLTWRP